MLITKKLSSHQLKETGVAEEGHKFQGSPSSGSSSAGLGLMHP